ncbi:site-specific integrase [Nocardiopsis alba]|uniref:tyrosine-type recombinase/integrase n=1 Tax=Nocardiopsis alba TaxID=53437 RepID=UPI0033D866C0
MNAALPAPTWPESRELARIEELIAPEFLVGIGWNADLKVMFLPPEHPYLGYAICKVESCDVVAVRLHGLCPSCHIRWKAVQETMTIEEFWQISRTGRVIGEVPCAVSDCGRLAKSTVRKLCMTHEWQRTRTLKISLEEFLVSPLVKPLPAFELCTVAACHRQRQSNGPLQMCRAHNTKFAMLRRKDSAVDLETFRRTQGAVVERGLISLRGLPQRVISELLLGLQLRCADDTKTTLRVLRNFTYKLRVQQVATIRDVTGFEDNHTMLALWRSITRNLDRAQSSPERERHKDLWNATVFGHRGTIDFRKLHQPWLREAAKEWVFEVLPTHRGKGVSGLLRSRVTSLTRLSESLRLQNAEEGMNPAGLGRADIVAFLNRLAYLEANEQISRQKRVRICRDASRILRDFRALGMTRSGKQAAGLAEDFALRRGDVPADIIDDEPGRALPVTILRQLYEALPALEARSTREVRIGVELLMDTGRRPDEILKLPLDCLDQDSDGKFALIYEDFKQNRKNRRLPITDATAELIQTQQRSVPPRFPDTDREDLVLLPAFSRNPHGTKPIPQNSFTDAHRIWVLGLEALTNDDGTDFARKDVVPYTYRHSFAQRHADAGVPMDVLRDLMGHLSTTTTQVYYRVTEKRTREAVDRVARHQFDRHGNRLWRQAQALLDDERARLHIGQVAVPYGICTEPTNVQAGGHSCPFRFRCVGCGHFRTDASYLPDLKAYLQDLLRDRERAMASQDLDEWARTEVTPSETEIRLIRDLIRRIENDLGDLTSEERQQIEDAVSIVRSTRRTVDLGMPRIAPPRPVHQGEAG